MKGVILYLKCLLPFWSYNNSLKNYCVCSLGSTSRSFTFQPNLISDGRNMCIWQGRFYYEHEPTCQFTVLEAVLSKTKNMGNIFAICRNVFLFSTQKIKRPGKPEDWYQSCLWRNGTRISIWNVPNVENGTAFIEDLHYSWKFSVASIQKVVFNFILDIRLNTLKHLNEVVWT